MIALPRTRGFTAGNWQILVTNNVNAVGDGMYMALTFFGAEQTAELLSKAHFRNRVRQRGDGEDPQLP